MNEITHRPYSCLLDEGGGYVVYVPLPAFLGEGSAGVVAIKDNHSEFRFYVETDERIRSAFPEDRDEVCEQLEEKALRYLSENRFDEEFSQWADKVLGTADCIWEQLEANKFEQETEIFINGDFCCVVTPCFDDYENRPEKPNKEDVDFYLVDSNEISGGHSLYCFANQCAQRELLHNLHLSEESEIQKFYDEKIYPIRNIPFKDCNDEQQEQLSFYSDWHKDVFGHRPHGKANDECFKRHNSSRLAERDR